MCSLNYYFSKILNVIFPHTCFICKEKDITLCEKCLKNFKRSIDSPFLYSTSVYSFRDNNIKRIIHAIKYHHRKDLIEPLVNEVAKELIKSKNQELKDNNWTLIPVPMHKIRKYMRGYNQSELIAKELSKKTSLESRNDLLMRIHTTRHQVASHSRSERLKNQHNSFQASDTVRGLNIILVDDVITTGATVSEARNVLLKAGASKVMAVSIAH